tara:strand:- start:23124 stop:23984 length:861 start_codon:yes stop_codon:yes gene_type:complete
VILLFNLGIIGSTDDDAGSVAGGALGLTATILKWEYGCSEIGDAALFNAIGGTAFATPIGYVAQPPSTITSMGTAALPSPNTDVVYPIYDGQQPSFFGSQMYFNYYDIITQLQISGGTAPYTVSFTMNVDLALSGNYLNGVIAYVGDISLPLGATATFPDGVVAGRTINPSGTPAEQFLWSNTITAAGTTTHPITDSFSALNLSGVSGGSIPPIMSDWSFNIPMKLAFDCSVNAAYAPFAGASMLAGQIIPVHITTISVTDSASGAVDIIATQYGGSPVEFRFLIG